VTWVLPASSLADSHPNRRSKPPEQRIYDITHGVKHLAEPVYESGNIVVRSDFSRITPARFIADSGK